jgi:hypothetical protein
MKLFIFDINEYSEFFIVMSESKETALESLKKYINEDEERKKYHSQWLTATIDNLPGYREKYRIDEYEADQVIEREYS